MLRLLAQRGEQGYEDIAALKGLSVDDVRAQVREAVTQMEDEGLPPPALPLDPKPLEPVAAEPTKPEPPAPQPPRAEPEPPVEPPKVTPPAPEPVAATPPPRAAKSGGPKISLPSDPGIRGALIAGVLVVAALIVVLIVSGGDGDSGDSTTAASDTAQEAGEAQNTASGESRKLTKAVLTPVDGGDASGVAIFGRLKKSLALQVEASGLEPTANGQAYAVWLSQSPEKMLPLASTPVDDSGRIGAQFEVPIEVLGYLANETFKEIAVTLVDEAALKASLEKATKAKESPEYTGTEVLRGTVTGQIVGAAKDE